MSEPEKSARRTTYDPVAYGKFVLEGMAAKLAKAGIDEPEVKVRWLIQHVTGVSFGELATRGLKPMIREQWDALGAFLHRVIQREPIQYVVGNTDFMGRIFTCDPRALIPRPETEELVETVLKTLGPGAHRVIDVGTGTGCIAVTLAAENPSLEVMAVDISDDALALARENAQAHALEHRITFRRASLLDDVPPASLDVVVSNPPYIADGEAASLSVEVRDHEPALALFAGADGLAAIRPLVAQAATALRPGGRLFLEIGENQGASVRALLESGGWTQIEIRKDLAGHDRIAMARHAD